VFGLINRAIRDLVVRDYGEDRWREILHLAEVPDEPFVAMERYPDEVTVRLVGAASQRLGIGSVEILRAFGRHWMLFTAEVGYGELLRSAGDSVAEFLGGLNNLHTRMQLSLPHLIPPVITVTDITPNSLHVHYRSKRVGLTPLAFGILEGLGTRFGHRFVIEEDPQPSTEGDYTVFRVIWGEQPSAPLR
jgi:hypothetical protein